MMADATAVSPGLLLAGYCVCVLLASLAGGWIPLAVRLTHTRLQMATSLVAGLMLGVGLLHMLPHAWHQLRSIDASVAWLLGGFLLMFFVQRFFHFHHHDVPEEAPELSEAAAEGRPETLAGNRAGAHEHRSHAEAEPHRDHTLADKSARRLSWGGALLGLSLHTLTDGVALAASVEAEVHAGSAGLLLGLGTFLVVFLHKPFDSLAIGTLLMRGGGSRTLGHVVNGLFALVFPLGILLFQLGADHFAHDPRFLGAALAFTGGTFLCIATIDLLPELQFHAHDRIKLSLALLAGLAVAVGLGGLETTGHDHHHTPPLAPSGAAPPAPPGR